LRGTTNIRPCDSRKKGEEPSRGKSSPTVSEGKKRGSRDKKSIEMEWGRENLTSWVRGEKEKMGERVLPYCVRILKKALKFAKLRVWEKGKGW